MTMNADNRDDGLIDGERLCDCCGRLIAPGEKANPDVEAEAFCASCWDGILHDFGEEQTARIPVETMSEIVFGEVA